MQVQGTVFDIKKYSLHDGPGIRTTVFLKGCPLSCWWCHNPESQNPQPDPVMSPGFRREFFSADDGSGSGIGRLMSVPEVMAEVEKDIIFYDESGGGVTFSGGEPLMQPDFLRDLLLASKAAGLHTAVDTTGYGETSVVREILPLTGLFLYDLKLADDREHQKYTGVSNSKVLHHLRLLSDEGADIEIRVPVIPGITDTEHNLEGIAALIRAHSGISGVGLLAYNHFGDHKYKRLQKDNPMPETVSPSQERMNELAEFFADRGIPARIGG